jgi:ankyrin repeat protein
MRQDTFTRYAGHNWFVHARKAAVAGADQSNLFPILDDMFESQKLADIMVLSGIGGKYGPSSSRGETPVQATPVYAASVLGLHEYIKVLVSRPDTEVNQGCNPEESPLCYAARKGYADIVAVLLNAGADHAKRATKTYSRLTPLHYAVQNNHPEVIKLLLAAGADITRGTGFDDRSSFYNVRTSAFGMACTVGHHAALQAVLPFIKSENLIIRAIFMVAKHGRADMMLAVLAHPLAQSAVNSKMNHNTPLFLACANRVPLMVKSLLQAGADATTLCGTFCGPYSIDPNKGYNGLHAWAGLSPSPGGRDSNPEPKEYDIDSTKEVFKLLVEAGARITQLDGDLSTPLHYAENALAARLLVDEGADINAVDMYGRTILHLTRDPAMTQYLLDEAKASTDLKTAADPPMLEGMRDGSDAALEQVQIFLDYGADPSVTDNAGNSALHLLINNNPERGFYGLHGVGEARVPLMRRFVRSGLDINARNAKGQTALHLMGMRSQDGKKNSELLEAMLAEGADIDATDALGRTPLFFKLETSRYLSDSDITDALDEMTRAGAQIRTRDSSGQTLFHAIINQCDEERIQKLVDRGLDSNTTDDCGNT